jgi:hypothetical protein
MRIWSKQAYAKINQQNEKFLRGYISEEKETSSNYRVGIVGGGPKGAYAIERLASIWRSRLPGEKLEIICFNTDKHFSCGPNYLPNQPDFLLVNYSLGNIDFWTEEPEQLIEDRKSLLDFINHDQESDNMAASGEDFCSRALTGIYLQHCLCQLITSLPDSIRVQLVPNPVTAINHCGDELILSTENGKYHSFSEVICCTGHSYSFQDELSVKLKKNVAKSENLTYVEHIYPISNMRNTGFTGKDLLIKGMGLTFVDAVLGMTEGMGGRFESNDHTMTYIPSGLEPARIYSFSRSGLPMLARKAGKAKCLPLKYFTSDFVEEQLASGGKLVLERDIYPTIEKEYHYQYVKNLAYRYGLLDENDSSLNLDELEELARAFIPDYKPFDLQKFLFPLLIKNSHHDAVIEFIEQSISPAKFPIDIQVVQDMSAVWRAIYPFFSKLYNYGGLSGKSQKLVDQIYFGGFQRVSYGPPILNMRKIHALAEAGIVCFDIGSSPSLRTNLETQKFEIYSTGLLNSIKSDILINARIAKIGDMDSHSPIYNQLHNNYNLSLYQNESYKPGCLELDKDGVLINLKGVTLNGTPTEGWTLDNESLSRTNNNFITPWANKLVTNYVNQISKINAYCPSMD